VDDLCTVPEIVVWLLRFVLWPLCFLCRRAAKHWRRLLPSAATCPYTERNVESAAEVVLELRCSGLVRRFGQAEGSTWVAREGDIRVSVGGRAPATAWQSTVNTWTTTAREERVTSHHSFTVGIQNTDGIVSKKVNDLLSATMLKVECWQLMFFSCFRVYVFVTVFNHNGYVNVIPLFI